MSGRVCGCGVGSGVLFIYLDEGGGWRSMYSLYLGDKTQFLNLLRNMSALQRISSSLKATEGSYRKLSLKHVRRPVQPHEALD